MGVELLVFLIFGALLFWTAGWAYDRLSEISQINQKLNRILKHLEVPEELEEEK